LTRWIELLQDGVIELTPFPHSAETLLKTTSKSTNTEEEPQGLLKIHRLPISGNRGAGIREIEDDWAFTLSRRRLTLRKWNLEPVDDEPDPKPGNGHEDQHGSHEKPKAAKGDLEF
jgi:elongator complex protein 4